MVETLESKIRKLEGKSGPQSDDDIRFTVYLVKESKKKPGTYLRRESPGGKYTRIVDPASLGIQPYTPQTRPQAVIEASPANINVPSKQIDPSADIEEESPEERISRIQKQIYKDFNR
jgi:hypothetical protein